MFTLGSPRCHGKMPAIMDAKDDQMQPPTAANRLLSVGHSNHDWPRLLGLLRGAGVTAVADVRSSPFSRRLPEYNRAALEGALRANGLAFVYLGDLLGGRPADRDLYHPEGWADYERIRQTAAFGRGLDRLLRGTDRFTVAILCAEEDPLDCHRGLMITPALVERGVPPLHLRGDGSLQTTADMEKNLLDKTGLTQWLFGDALAEAYRRMNAKVAYRLLPEEGD
jgi:uncharacterized protein (DUF488 family)